MVYFDLKVPVLKVTFYAAYRSTTVQVGMLRILIHIFAFLFAAVFLLGSNFDAVLASCDVGSIGNSSLDADTLPDTKSALPSNGKNTTDTKDSILELIRRLPEGIEKNIGNSSVLNIYHKISEGSKSIGNLSIEEDYDDLGWLSDFDFNEGNESEEDSTESLGVDANGCNRHLRRELEERCDNEYEKVNQKAQDIEDHSMKTEALCCALEDFEKCNLRAFDKANCGNDKATIRENMKAARLFITVIANVTCSRFRGQCAYYSSSMSWYASYSLVLASVLIQLVRFLV